MNFLIAPIHGLCNIARMNEHQHSTFIRALGDTAAVAKLTGEHLSTVSNWKERGIPWRWRPTIAQAARRKKVALPDDFLEPERA